MTTRPFPHSLTSYDLLKTAALLLMILDHAGYYFFPEDMWFRAVGRLSAPVWLFLIGYARSRDLSVRLWAGMALLVVANYVVGMPLLPINILGTIILARLMLDPLMNGILRRKEALYPVLVLLFILTLVTAACFEYGTGAMAFVMLGYLARNREAVGLSRGAFYEFSLAVGISHALTQCFASFKFDLPQMIAAGVGIMVVTFALTQFRGVEYARAPQILPAPILSFFRFCGRNTLELYVIHLLMFKAAALWTGHKDFGLFDFHIF